MSDGSRVWRETSPHEMSGPYVKGLDFHEYRTLDQTPYYGELPPEGFIQPLPTPMKLWRKSCPPMQRAGRDIEWWSMVDGYDLISRLEEWADEERCGN